MKQPIIEIPQASESTIKALINLGILEKTEDGIKVVDNGKALPPTKARQD